MSTPHTRSLVGERGRLPDLSALLPGLRRRRGRRPARASRRGSTTSPGWASTRSGSRRSIRRRCADMGYDVADYTGVAPEYGTLADVDELIARAHERGHPRAPRPRAVAHLDRAPVVSRAPGLVRLGRRRARRTTGSRASAARPGRRDERSGPLVPALLLSRAAGPGLAEPGGARGVRRASCGSGRDRGVDGFRVDAIDRVMKDARLRDDPPATEPFGLPLPDGVRRARPRPFGERPGDRPRARRDSRGGRRRVPGRRGLPADRQQLGPYLEHLDLRVRLRAPARAVRGGPRCAR